VSASRTSRNTWVARGASELSERVYRRAADVLGVDHTLLSEDTFLAEHLQLVHYAVGDKYDSHYDWSPKNVTRLCTLLLYLNDPVEGGATSFPRAERSEAEGPLVLHPGKGGAVLFYNLLPDGNADETSLHAALPVIAGEKWIANLWVWDHRRP
jgi:prolyl 4-hydroxylase